MNQFLGNFLGFTYNTVHSSELGITRTNDGTYFSKSLLPSIKTTTATIHGMDGAVEATSHYSTNDITIHFAFKGLSERQVNLIKSLLNDKQIHPLLFDELPYIIYYAKVTGLSTCKRMVFDDNGSKVYNGEGTLYFVCDYPFGKSRYEYLSDYDLHTVPEWVSPQDRAITEVKTEDWAKETRTNPARIQYDLGDDNSMPGYLRGALTEFKDWVTKPELLVDIPDIADMGNSYMNIGVIEETSPYVNIDQWREVSEMPENNENTNFQSYLINNTGDLPMPFVVWFYAPKYTTKTIAFSISIDGQNLTTRPFTVPRASNQVSQDYFIVVDTRNHMIYGYNQFGKPTGSIYNEYITVNDDLSIPVGEHTLSISSTAAIGRVDYHYRYL